MAIKLLSVPSDSSQQKASSAGGPGSEVAGLASLLIAMNRISNRLQRAASSVRQDLTTNDWLLLQCLQQQSPLSMAEASRTIGLSQQRVHQQVEPLSTAGFISVNGEGTTKELSLTKSGKELVRELEGAFRLALAAGEQPMPTGPINSAQLSTRKIIKALTPPKAAK